MSTAMPLPPPYEYTSFDGQKLLLYPYAGTHVVLLVTEKYYDQAVLTKITQAVDRAYDYYMQATGREPAPYNCYQGRSTIAVVPSNHGAAGLGMVGVTGIQILTDNFDTLFRGVADHNQFDQLVFYELGRNFWFYEDKVSYPAQDSIATGFAVFMRFMSMEAAGIAGGPFGNQDFDSFKAEVKGLLDIYLADPSLNWSNTLQIGKSPGAGGGTDLFASFMFGLRDRFGDAFLMNIWKEIDALPVRITTQDAVDNFVTAASRAAKQNLRGLFAYTWRWPVSSHQYMTIPALREYTLAADAYTFSAETRIVIDRAALRTTATVFANDLLALTTFTLPVVQDVVPAAGDIVLSLGATDSAIGSEGYVMEVGSTLAICAQADAGVFYGTRTILQLLTQGNIIAGGTARDWPSYPERSLMVDNGRKYFSPDWLTNHIRELAYLKYNYFHFHLSDDQGFHLESSTVTPSQPILSKAELTSIIALATQYHISIVPEIEMPGHMGAILPADLRLPYDDGTITANSYLNIASDAGYAFAQRLIDEYIDLFPGPYWHMGGDEFGVDWGRLNHLRDYVRAKLNNSNASAQDGFFYFVNWVNAVVKAKGKRLRIWGSPLSSGTVLRFDPDITPELWDQSVDPNDAIYRGYAIINASFYPTYYVQGWESQNPPRPQYPAAALYEQWTPQKFFAEQFPPYSLVADPVWTIPSPPSTNLLGGKFQIWSDNPFSRPEQQVAADIYEKLRAMAQNNWGSPKQAISYADFEPMIQAIGRAPGYVQSVDQPYDFKDEIVNPNTTIPSGHYGNLIGDGMFGWQTSTCAIDVRTNGFVFTLDSGNGNPLNYGGVIEGSGSVVLRSAAASNASTKTVPLILSGNLPNRYSGVTTLKQGVVELAKGQGITAIPGNLVMEPQGDNDELRWAASEQIADSADLIILSRFGNLNLNNFQETIRNLRMVAGASIQTGTAPGGTLTVHQFWYHEKGYSAGIYTAANAPFVQGTGSLVVRQAPITIMPLGDSITFIPTSYRGVLFTQLSQAGYPIDMVGTQSNPAEGGTDPDHEGHDGATIGPGEPNEWGDNPATGYKNNLYDLAPTFMTQNPDVILLLIGINDYTNYRSATDQPIHYNTHTHSPPKLAGLIDRILADKPDVHLLVASLLPVATEHAGTHNVGPFNATIPDIVAQRATAGKHVYFVDMNVEAGIDPNDRSQLYDGIHPTIQGSNNIASVWFKHLKRIFASSLAPIRTSTPTATATPPAASSLPGGNVPA